MTVVEQFSCKKGKEHQFVLPWCHASSQVTRLVLPFKHKSNGHQEQNSSHMPIENKNRRAHAFIESIFGYYLHASIYSPQQKRNNESCSIAHCLTAACWNVMHEMALYIIKKGGFYLAIIMHPPLVCQHALNLIGRTPLTRPTA